MNPTPNLPALKPSVEGRRPPVEEANGKEGAAPFLVVAFREGFTEI